jgi:hypothetical protein
MNGLVLHKIKDIQSFNTSYTLNYPLLTNTLWPMKHIKIAQNSFWWKIHKYTNILKVISLNFDPYNSCNHFSKSWGCMILCMCMQSLVPFIVNTPHYTRKPLTSKMSNKKITSRLWISYINCWTWDVRWNLTLLTWNLPWAPMKHPLNWSDWVRKQLYPFFYICNSIYIGDILHEMTNQIFNSSWCLVTTISLDDNFVSLIFISYNRFRWDLFHLISIRCSTFKLWVLFPFCVYLAHHMKQSD